MQQKDEVSRTILSLYTQSRSQEDYRSIGADNMTCIKMRFNFYFLDKNMHLFII